MNLKEKMFINGYVVDSFAKNMKLNSLQESMNEVIHGNIKPGFSMKEKYRNSLDLRPNVFSYDESFIDILIDNDIHEFVNSVTGINLELAHIQLRIAQPSSTRSMGYTGWHRDTHFYKGSDVTGNIPSAYKLIYYPSLDQKITPQLKVLSRSHQLIFKRKIIDVLYSRIAKATTISSSNDDFIFFNTIMYHKAIKPILEQGSLRLIYTFVRKEQLEKYDQKLNLMYKKKLRLM
jgi:hypothetical protein